MKQRYEHDCMVCGNHFVSGRQHPQYCPRCGSILWCSTRGNPRVIGARARWRAELNVALADALRLDEAQSSKGSAPENQSAENSSPENS